MMKSFKRHLQEARMPTKTITIACNDPDNTLEKLLNHIKEVGNTGHSFNIEIEGKNFNWDGDGSDSIQSIVTK